jgi:hypothetical protein
MALFASSERSQKRWNRLSLVPPLMGFECRPPTGIPPARPLPEAEAPFGPTLPGAGSRSALVVSHHLDGLLRAEVAGLLHPATGQGFAAFRACRLHGPPEGDSIGRVTLPATRFTPFEDFPSSAAVLHHCSRCLPAVTVLPGARSQPKLVSVADRQTTEVGDVQSAGPYPRVAGGPAPRGWVAGGP